MPKSHVHNLLTMGLVSIQIRGVKSVQQYMYTYVDNVVTHLSLCLGAFGLNTCFGAGWTLRGMQTPGLSDHVTAVT